MGLIVLAIAILPLLGIGGRQMFKAETPGPMKDAKMTPRIAETAKGLWLVYLGASIACVVSYHWAGMSWFDAVCHGFSTMGLGGFSTHDASFGFFNSPAIEFVAIVFMLIAGMNFGTLFLAVSGRSIRPYLHDPEAAWFLGVTLISILVVAIYIWKDGAYTHLETALRHTAFNLISIATTTGYASVDYSLWPIFAPLWMLFLSSFATSAGSRWRHQDDASRAALQAGLSRTVAGDASECRVQHSYWQSGSTPVNLLPFWPLLSCTWSASFR
jgi:trk system potassium uptake protein TrkH